MSHRTICRIGFLSLVGLSLVACTLAPMSRTVAPGSTIVIPLSGERSVETNANVEHPIAYNYQLPGSSAVTDVQRGSMFAMMCPHVDQPVQTLESCTANPAKRDLAIKYITRLYPDPASPAGIENVVQDMSVYMSDIPMSGQVMLFADIPTSVNNDFPASCAGASPPQTCFDPKQYDVFVGLHKPNPPGGPDETFNLNQGYDRRINVVRLSANSLANP